tara:strand:- start:1701 stop:1958 length:258 start_codon:yes stop_codon:yes gene_type:complete
MIIPIRCFTCGEILADKWKPFIIMTNDKKNNDEDVCENELNIKTIQLGEKIQKSVEGEVLDKLNLHKICCRRMMLSNVSLISYIN